MRIRLHLEGSGTEDDPITVRFPHWRMVAIDYERGVMVVDIPDRAAPDNIRQIAAANPPPTVDSGGIIVPARALDEWRRYLDAVYKERAGEYAPVVE